MKKYRVGIIGLGRMGSTLDMSIAASSQAIERLELVAGADILPDRRTAFKEKWGVKAVYADYDEMLKKEEPDLVAVCTTATGLPKPGNRAPTRQFRGDSHADITARVADAGVPMVFCEKALACSMVGADKVLAACARRGTALNTGVVMRFDNRFRAVRDLIQRGDIGTPTHAVAYTESNTLMHMHSHSIDMLSYLLGDAAVVAVRGELFPRELKVADNRLDEDPHATYHIRFAGGVEAWSIPAGPRDFEVVGTEGMVRVMDTAAKTALWETGSVDGRRGPWAQAKTPRKPAANNRVVTCLEDLVDAYESKRPTRGGGAKVAHNVTEACLAVADSHRQGGTWVPLPLKNRDLYVFHV